MITLVVVTWNSANALPGLLESIPDGLGELPYELIVVDNDSADDTVALARRLAPECRVVQTGRNAGYAAGINAGLAEAKPHRATMVLNPDIRLAPDSVETLFSQLGGRTGITVPMIRHDDGSLAHSLRREPTLARAFGEALLGQKAGKYRAFGETVVDEAAYRRTGPADWATGAAMLISAECEEACGPWDESFFLYSEETDYALRARDHGFQTKYVPSASVTHLGGESRVSPALWSLLTVNKVKLYRKRHSAPKTALFWSAVMLREASRAAIGHKRSRKAAAALLGRRRDVPTGAPAGRP